MSGVQVQFLVGEIISHMPHGFKKKKKKTKFKENKVRKIQKKTIIYINILREKEIITFME